MNHVTKFYKVITIMRYKDNVLGSSELFFRNWYNKIRGKDASKMH